MRTLTLIFIFSLAACSHSEPKPMTETPAANAAPLSPSTTESEKKSVSIEAKLAGAQDNTPYVTEVKFEKNSSELSPAEQKKIIDLLHDAKPRAEANHQPITHVKFLVWSDLPDAAVHLAEARGQTLTLLLHEQDASLTTHTINMAQEPSKFHEFIKTDSVRIRESLDIAGKADPKASHAIVMLVTKQK
jgi:hypothetical protein